MKTDPLVSIIIPTYNRSNLLLETIISIQNQTYDNLEIIIISDSSTDDTHNKVKSINDSRIKLIILEKNSGLPAVPRNHGLKLSKGDLIAFCDDDDIWLPNKLQEQVKLLDEKNDALLVCSNATTFPTNNPRICVAKWKSSFLSLEECIYKKNPIVNSSVVIRKKVIDLVGYLDENPELKASEDYDYWLRILAVKNNSIYYDKRSFVKYRIQNNKISNITNQDFIRNKFSIIYNKHFTNNTPEINIIKRNKESILNKYNFAYKIGIYLLTRYIMLISR